MQIEDIIGMPGQSYRGPLPPLTESQEALRDRLAAHVSFLADTIGPRHVWEPDSMARAADYVRSELQAIGYAVEGQDYDADGVTVENLQAELPGTDGADQVLVVGAHYDSIDCPGANDNASGVAGVIEIARALSGQSLSRTVRFVAFANEEPPFFHTDLMGSLVYARGCRERRENIAGAVILEEIGFYCDAPDSQHYSSPFDLFYPSTGDFIGFVGSMASGDFVRECVGAFRKQASFPSEGGAVPEEAGVAGLSDQWAFWQCGYPGLMVTDTAPFRYPHYHMPEDTPDKLDYARMARVVEGMASVVTDLAGA